MIDEKTKIGKCGGGGVFLHKMVVLSKHHSTVYKIASQVLHSCIDKYDIVPTFTYTLQGGGLRPNTPNASKCRGMFYFEYLSKHF